MSPRRLLSVLPIVLFFISSLTAIWTSIGAEAPASIVSEAGKSVSEAYEGVLNAERAGANVSGLVARLNEAGGLLTNALMANRTGDFEEASSFAYVAKSRAQEVRDEAYALKDRASLEALQRLRFTAISSVVGMALIVIGSLVGWHILKKIHSRQILRMRPEVFSNESSTV